MTYRSVELCKVLGVSRKSVRMIQHFQGEILFFPVSLNSVFPRLYQPLISEGCLPCHYHLILNYLTLL